MRSDSQYSPENHRKADEQGDPVRWDDAATYCEPDCAPKTPRQTGTKSPSTKTTRVTGSWRLRAVCPITVVVLATQVILRRSRPSRRSAGRVLVGWHHCRHLWRRADRPCDGVSTAARVGAKISAGDYEVNIPVKSRDEIGDLTTAFNRDESESPGKNKRSCSTSNARENDRLLLSMSQLSRRLRLGEQTIAREHPRCLRPRVWSEISAA